MIHQIWKMYVFFVLANRLKKIDDKRYQEEDAGDAGDSGEEILYFFNVTDVGGARYENMILTFNPRLFKVENMDLIEDVFSLATGEVHKYQFVTEGGTVRSSDDGFRDK